MKVKFRTNLGSIDARELGVDHKDCKYEEVVDVPDAAAAELIKRGIAEEVASPKPASKKAEVQATDK